MEITVTYTCGNCGLTRTETMTISENGKVCKHCTNCEEQDVLILDATKKKILVYA